MSDNLIAVFDSGVDYKHHVFRLTDMMSYEDIGGGSVEQLYQIRRAAIQGQLTTTDIVQYEHAFPYDYCPTASQLLVPVRDFAGLHPDYDMSDTPTTNIFDINGHGTATAGIIAMRGIAVLPVKVAYSLIPEISLPGLIEACEWLIDQVHRGLPCNKAVWTFSSTDPDALPIYSELISQRSNVGITVWAVGRGVLESLESASLPLWPADIDSVIAVDEDLHLNRYMISQGEQLIVAHGLPGSVVWLDEKIAQDGGTTQIHIDCVTNDKLRSTSHLNPSDVLLVIDSIAPYVFRPDDEVFTCPVLVSTTPIDTILYPDKPVMIRRISVGVFHPCCLSSGKRKYGRTGILAPAALNPNGWVPAFGPSCAAPEAATH
ncbi:MAG: hypothetical protein GFH27_549379n21 [Chloroflexi bacterium AL-W]|nr:hypothetical protein [Chloroflexi bacterium AL-N1]NOK71145.1 hypothetical protein [Chloroflexi bacterium AL-N10]NOK78611.1 hypothetical protein [Chloroflexi bacterium AL-N5]NOK85907.1 hypothetical protein [Chloroflexi bacterium AL-W]NOK92882.1 hypothetical protein [Chloroflexi bacterium AL-N15]